MNGEICIFFGLSWFGHNREARAMRAVDKAVRWSVRGDKL